ncbi:MAG: PfkB family carbohydrate kinase [Chloroflexota bacterium]
MQLAGVGDNVVDRYRDLGMMFPGGQALNVAVHAGRAGVETAYVGAVGDDRAGRHVLGVLREEGVDTSHVRVVPGPNAYANVGLRAGNREFLGGSAGVSRIRLSEDDLAFLGGARLIHSSESSYLEDQLALLAGVAPLSFDFSIRRDQEYLEPILPHVAIAAFSLADLDDDEASAFIDRIHRAGPRVVIATRGASDAMLSDTHRVWRQPALPTQVVDTLGAGDAFIARVLVGSSATSRSTSRSRQPRAPRQPPAPRTGPSATASRTSSPRR